MTNTFITRASMISAETTSEKGALKYSTTNNHFVDQFGALGGYTSPRSISAIYVDMSTLFSQNKEYAVKFAFYMRMITRTLIYQNGEKSETIQRGAGLMHEAIVRFMWLAQNHPNIFWNNVHLIPVVGSWKDIFKMMEIDALHNGSKDGAVFDMNWNKLSQFIIAGLENPQTSELVKKYLPTIKSKSNTITVESEAKNKVGRFIAKKLFGDNKPYAYKQYRKLKASGTAHTWQQLISKKLMDEINFSSVHGRALAKMVSGEFISNNKLEDKYVNWLSNQDMVKFVGYPHELFANIDQIKKSYQSITLNKQFDMLVDIAKQNAVDNTSMIVVRDTSGSMTTPANGSKMSCYNIAKALALFFSYMLPEGPFANNWIEFNYRAVMHTWKGSNAYEKWKNDSSMTIGNTNFASVFNLFAEIKMGGVPESQFPTGIICISDSEFDPTSLNETNVQNAKRVLTEAGFSEEFVSNFKIVLWNLLSENTPNYETYGNSENTFYFSGYDASTIAFLTGIKDSNGKVKTVPKTDVELFKAAMDQEVLNQIVVG
jgi:hypothetical protein